MEEQKQVPKLRFVEFSDEWKDEKVGMLGTFKGGGTPSTNNSEYWQGETPWISSSVIKENDIHNINISRYLSELAITESATKVIPKGSILFVARVGIGKVAVANQDLCTSQDFANLIPRKDDSYYIAYYFISKSKLLFQYSQGTSIKGFTSGDLKSIPINIPTLPEQQKIASFLSSVDKKIAQLKQKQGLLEDYKRGVMQQIFSQQLRFTDENGNEYPKWEEKRLGDVLKIGSGKDYKHLTEGLIPVYGTGGLMAFVSDYLYEGESVGIGRKGTIDKPVFLEGKFWTVDTLFYTHSFKNVLPKFIFYLFLLINWKKYNEASGVPSLSKGTIEKIIISFPSIEEQTQIALFLSAIDKKIAKIQTQIDKTQTFKKGLLQQMFV
ncbi:MAG: restriction endonuclease subunit S [Muricauda sp. TMED12]|nr:MAG: restriction endonuclease subunit S [Muricauda sp. TMED12]